MSRHDVTVTVPWVADGTELLLETLQRADLGAPSRLPGWTGAHIAAHLAGNAQALCRLMQWGRTGVETPMYASPDARAAEIEAGARRPVDALRADVATTAAALAEDMAKADDAVWDAPVRSAKGRSIPVREVPWLRAREVWLHAVDLADDLSLQDVPPAMRDVLLEDVLGSYAGRPATPRVELTCGGRQWVLGSEGEPQPLAGERDDVLAWLTGRPAAPGAAPLDAPAMPPWL